MRDSSSHVTPAFKPRPLSPHISIYRRTITMMISIIHRITGVGLYFGMLVVALRLFTIAGPQDSFDQWNEVFFYSPLGKVMSFFFVWAIFHHMFGGIRHLIQDFGYGFDPVVSSRMAWCVLVGSVVFTCLFFGFFTFFYKGLI